MTYVVLDEILPRPNPLRGGAIDYLLVHPMDEQLSMALVTWSALVYPPRTKVVRTLHGHQLPCNFLHSLIVSVTSRASDSPVQYHHPLLLLEYERLQLEGSWEGSALGVVDRDSREQWVLCRAHKDHMEPEMFLMQVLYSHHPPVVGAVVSPAEFLVQLLQRSHPLRAYVEVSDSLHRTEAFSLYDILGHIDHCSHYRIDPLLVVLPVRQDRTSLEADLYSVSANPSSVALLASVFVR